MIDLNCPAPEQPHAPGCDRTAHILLLLDVESSIAPPIFRAVARDHGLCSVYPCADCRGTQPVAP